MSEIEELLTDLGLEKYESRAIVELLKSELTLKELSRLAKIPFGKVYSVVKGLKAKGFVDETSWWPKKVFIPDASGSLQRIFAERMARERRIREELTLLVSENELARNKHGFFQVGTTNKENFEIQLAAFRQVRHEILQIINIHHRPSSNRMAKSVWEKEILACLKRGVSFRAIYPVKSILSVLLQDAQKKHPNDFVVRRRDTDFMRCDIIDRDFVLLKLVHEDPLQFGGVLLLRSERLNENLRTVFYTLWAEGV